MKKDTFKNWLIIFLLLVFIDDEWVEEEAWTLLSTDITGYLYAFIEGRFAVVDFILEERVAQW